MPITDWLTEFWRSAQQASPFGAMGAVLVAIILWRRLIRSQDDLLRVTVKGIEALHSVERTLDEFVPRKPRRRRRVRGGK